MADGPELYVANIGKQLARQSRLSKDFIVKSLRQAVSVLSELEQSSSFRPVIKPLTDSLVKHGLLQHKDKDIKLLVAICFSEIIRILAPEPSFSDNLFRDIFELFISMFAELADTTSPFFSRRVKILETVAALQCCQRMLDIGCDDLILKMFHTFFSVVREEPKSLFSAMLSIMMLVVKEEDVSRPLLEVILQNLKRKREDPEPASYVLAVALIRNCEENVKPAICGFLTSCILSRENVPNELNESYHEVILGIFRSVPQMLLPIIPSITQELLTDQVDIRIKSVNLVGDLLALPKEQWRPEDHLLLDELLKRFSDRVAEVRARAIRAAKTCYAASQCGTEMFDILSALESRLLDVDANVRIEALIAVCDLAREDLKSFPAHLIAQVTERLRDKMISVRQKALKKLLEVYHRYCFKCSQGEMVLSENLEQIPCKILMLCYDKASKDFRPQLLELVLAEDFFPESLSVEDRMSHWILLCSNFTLAHVQALNSVLCQKRRLQQEMQVYLSLMEKQKENDPEELNGRIKLAFARIATSFPNPAEAEETLYKLNTLNDCWIFNELMQIMDEVEISIAKAMRNNFLAKLGDKNPYFEFLQLLSMKCMHNMFGSEHVRFILDHISCMRRGNCLDASSVDFLLVIISNFPTLMRGCEAQFERLFMESDSPFIPKLVEILTKAGPFISIKLSDVYATLEGLCLEGTRAESKAAIACIKALADPSQQFIYAGLCEKLVQSLRRGCNLPTVLQSLGCIAKYSFLTFQKWEKEISSYIEERIFTEKLQADASTFDENSGCAISFNCKMKIWGLKTLVNYFMSNGGPPERLNKLLDILSDLLQMGKFSDAIASENDMAHIRLASAKSVLRLSRRWDLYISPKLFQSTMMMVKDPSSFVRELFIDKTHKLLTKHAVPSRYACALVLATSDCMKDLQESSLKYMVDFIKENSKVAQIRQISTSHGKCMMSHPAYIIVFLLHLLAHNKDFPPENCRDEEMFAEFCRPLLSILRALGNSQLFNGDIDVVNNISANLLSIFRAIKRAEDALDSQLTPRLHLLADIGTSIVNGIKQKSVKSSCPPAVILLPSAFYTTSLSQIGERADCSTGVVFDEEFREKLVHFVKFRFDQPSTNVPERFCYSQKDVNSVDQRTLGFGKSQKMDWLKNKVGKKSKEMSEAVTLELTNERNRRSVSPYSSRELQLPSDRSTVEDLESNDCRNSRPAMREDPHVFKDESSRQTGIESEISTQETGTSFLSSQENDRKRKADSKSNEPQKLSETGHRRSLRLKKK